jgi:penicillin-binding protein 1B
VLKVPRRPEGGRQSDADRAIGRPLGITDNAKRSTNYFPAFLDLVRRQLRSDYEESQLTEAGLVVFTTLDPLLQQQAEDALSDELEQQDKSPRKSARGSKVRSS